MWTIEYGGNIKIMVLIRLCVIRFVRCIIKKGYCLAQLSVPINGLVVFPSALEVNVEMDEILNGVEELNSMVMENNRVRVSCNELCRVIKAYGIEEREVSQMIHDFYRTNCPELLECTG